jgi:hypothetical protein
MTQMLVEEATHDGDFAEHLNLQRTRTFRGKEKNAFVHWYAKSAQKKKDYDPEDSSATFHGIMAYHGYKAEKSKDPTQIAYRGEDAHKEHRFSATVNSKGHVVGVQHHERFKDVNEEYLNETSKATKAKRDAKTILGPENSFHGGHSFVNHKTGQVGSEHKTKDTAKRQYRRYIKNTSTDDQKKLLPKKYDKPGLREEIVDEAEVKTFGKKLRDVIGRKTAIKDTVLDSPSAPSEKEAEAKFIKATNDGGQDFPDRNGNPDGFATSKSPGKKKYGPDAGKKEEMHSIKEEQFDEGVRDIATSSRAWAGAKSSLGGSRDRQFGKKTYRLPGQAAKSDMRSDASKLVADYRSSGGRINAKKTNEEVEHIDEDGISHHYHIVDGHTKTVVGKAKNLKSALRMVDKRDNAYGGYRYQHKRVEGPHPSMKNEEVLDEREGSHPVEYYDAMNRERKAKWHYDRVGKNKNASFKKGIANDYEAELLKRGVKDSNGNQKSLRKEEVEQVDELSRHGPLQRYINRTKDDPKREKGRNLALKKKWGDKKYGLEEPKVKATNEEVEELDEISDKAALKYKSKAISADSKAKAFMNRTHKAVDINDPVSQDADKYDKAFETSRKRKRGLGFLARRKKD